MKFLYRSNFDIFYPSSDEDENKDEQTSERKRAMWYWMLSIIFVFYAPFFFCYKIDNKIQMIENTTQNIIWQEFFSH